MTYKTWDFENDVIETKEELLLPPKTAEKYMGSAYAVETKIGIFYQKPDNEGTFDLIFIDNSGEHIYEKNIVVVASDMNYTCIVVHFEESGEYVLIDTRGEFFLLEIAYEKSNPAMYSMRFDRKTGFYSIGNKITTRWMIRGISKKKQFQRMMDFVADDTLQVNPKLKNLFKRSTEKYLYLTILNSKKGRLIDFLINSILPYEELPNVFVGDTTRNIRIPINSETLTRKEMHFLLEKYYNTYAIQGIPIEVFLGTLEIDYKYKQKLYVYCSSASESQYPKVVSIISSLKNLMGLENDLDLYKKLINRIIGLFPIAPELNYKNEFGKLLLPYPENHFRAIESTKRLMEENLEYIDTCLIPEKPLKNVNSLKDIEVLLVYRDLYERSKKHYKNELKKYEEEIMSKI